MHKYIEIGEALEAVQQISKDIGLTKQSTGFFEDLVLSCHMTEKDGQLLLDKHLFSLYCENYMKTMLSKDMDQMTATRGYKKQPVDIEEFLESKEYMNQRGHLRPVIKYELDRLFSNRDKYLEVILSGGIGIGKSFFSEMALSYLVYLNSCLTNMQAEYDLAPGSTIYFILQSVSMTSAKRVLFDQMMGRMSQTHYFTRVFPFDKKVRSMLKFPNGLYVTPVSSTEMSAIGLNVFAGVISEANFFQVIADSKLSKSADGTYDQAEQNYGTIMQRMRSRFDKMGKMPGMMILDSSARYPGDFLDRKMEEAKTDPSIFVMKYAQWEALPADRMSTEKFLVEIGNHERSSRILPKYEMAFEGSEVIEVPMNYFRDFQRNCEAALRDFAGIVLGVEGAFMKNKEAVVDAVRAHAAVYDNKQLFTMDDIIIDAELDWGSPHWAMLINQDYLKEPSFDAGATFALHADIGITHDSTGLVVGHIQDYVNLPSTSRYNGKLDTFVELTDLLAPVFCIDGIIRIRPPHGGEVHMDLLRGFIFYICQVLNIKFGTFDRFSSVQFIQGLRRLKVRSGLVSTVTTTQPYNELKSAYIEHRIIHPSHKVYVEELLGLQFEPKKNRIDHLPGAGKDCADAMASVVHILTNKVANYSRKHEEIKQVKRYQKLGIRKLRFR
jgi:hypothetical protein